ncbi:hypothetical protein [Salinicola tamaricis]|uniref:hypothetical protein n=1 Tax=Salinicola tamaricis TaxID=1771309 RepID=UPI0013EB5AAB|nr:hypothetical protein [Salinicola tamaricis]
MSIDRRRFLCRGAALSAGLLLAPGWRAWAQSAPMLDPRQAGAGGALRRAGQRRPGRPRLPRRTALRQL